MKKKLNLMDVKTALLDNRFRESLPTELLSDVQKFLGNPGCGCNHPIYKKVMKLAGKQLTEYYPTRETVDPDTIDDKPPENHWEVINCSIHDLKKKLEGLSPTRKHKIEIARWQDQVTVIINHVDAEDFM